MNDEKEIIKDKTSKEIKPAEKKPIKTVKKQSQDDFKRKYFEYYDDIKISDRQDW